MIALLLLTTCLSTTPTTQQAVGQATFMAISDLSLKDFKVKRWGNDLNPMSVTLLRGTREKFLWAVAERLQAAGFFPLMEEAGVMVDGERYVLLQGEEILYQTPLYVETCAP